MPATWPSTLQDKLNEEGFSFNTGSTVLRSDNQMGPAKVRRVMTKSVDTISGTINLTTAQFSVFNYFFDTTLNGGVGTFNFVHPITGVLTVFRFTRPPSYRSIGGGNFAVSMEWESLPT
jgi:hypothetical protein